MSRAERRRSPRSSWSAWSNRALLAHRSGISDDLDENEGVDVADYALSVPAHELATTEQFLSVLGGFPAKSPPDAEFTHNNGGYVVRALIAERVSGVAFAELVQGPGVSTGGDARHRVSLV